MRPVLEYAETEFRAAETTFQDGLLEYSRQKGKLDLLARYDTADSLLIRAEQLAFLAIDSAIHRQNSLKQKAMEQYDAFCSEMAAWREALDGSLISYKAEGYYTIVEMCAEASTQLLNSEKYSEAISTIKQGDENLNRIASLMNGYAAEEAKNLNQWESWIKNTIDETMKNKSYAIIVNKSIHKAYLIHKGKLVKVYNCDLGFNPARQKLFAGDGATPEGQYRVLQKRENGSKYYKALLLNYPTQADRKRFSDNKKKGYISASARIGKNIEIHGEGGKNSDWTDGCIALQNEDMDHLMRFIATGMPVTIVRTSEHWP